MNKILIFVALFLFVEMAHSQGYVTFSTRSNNNTYSIGAAVDTSNETTLTDGIGDVQLTITTNDSAYILPLFAYKGPGTNAGVFDEGWNEVATVAGDTVIFGSGVHANSGGTLGIALRSPLVNRIPGATLVRVRMKELAAGTATSGVGATFRVYLYSERKNR